MSFPPSHIDTHVHLPHPFDVEVAEAMIERALAQNIWMILVGDDFLTSVQAVEIAEQYPQGVYAAIGFHPSHVDGSWDTTGLVAQYRDVVRHPRVVAVGDIGLDYEHVAREDELIGLRAAHEQLRLLTDFFTLAHDERLPVIAVVRGADNEFLRQVRQVQQAARGLPMSGVVHHFIGDATLAQKYLDTDFSLSCTDWLARSHMRHHTIRAIPSERLLVESLCRHLTTGGFMAGGEPTTLTGTVGHIAALRGEDEPAVAKSVRGNALRLFPKIIRTLP